MSLSCGIVGLPNVGKSTLFNALTQTAKAQAANYPFCTIEPNVGLVEVPDPRLYEIARRENSRKITPTFVEFVDIAGLVRNASKGEGLGNQFLAHIREVDAIVQVLRCFEDPSVVHVEGDVNPVRDAQIIDIELIAKDLQTVEKRLEKVQKMARLGDKQALQELGMLEDIKKILENLEPLRRYRSHLSEETWHYAQKTLFLLTTKPVLYVANVGESDLPEGNRWVKELEEYAKGEGAPVVMVCAKLEAELVELAPEEKEELLRVYGFDEPGLNRLVREAYRTLGLITFFTAGEKETRAWTVLKGTKAPQAAGKIHSDMERGFIAAEVISYEDYIKVGSLSKAKEKGLVRLEGKDYVVQDGDIMYFRFNV
ncbi:GTP-binding protein YchF [Thermocrinis albus DSM 14484]|uniref:Ribosome-binding ATPase YchF n=1 Tax=Thermocrinis albus (strain DSM 14484 / JCM 11386 / HI 11/12) TaxID=638303 RepID=D3SNA0_THEAH|nr:redox-regulated ATPase YchF [Thermocrinis albus]ADC90230.1 GTP-binding protein YchF [Thermocrinis albus DSM 14484]